MDKIINPCLICNKKGPQAEKIRTISSHDLLGMWLLIHAEIKVKPAC